MVVGREAAGRCRDRKRDAKGKEGRQRCEGKERLAVVGDKIQVVGWSKVAVSGEKRNRGNCVWFNFIFNLQNKNQNFRKEMKD